MGRCSGFFSAATQSSEEEAEDHGDEPFLPLGEVEDNALQWQQFGIFENRIAAAPLGKEHAGHNQNVFGSDAQAWSQNVMATKVQ